MKGPVIVCWIPKHDENDISDELVGVSKFAVKPYDFVGVGTRVFMYYKGEGIQKIVEATSEPYYEEAVIADWEDAYPERVYPHRFKTRRIAKFQNPVRCSELESMGIKRRDTEVPFYRGHLQGNLVPIREEDAEKIEMKLRQRNK